MNYIVAIQESKYSLELVRILVFVSRRAQSNAVVG